MADDAAPVSLEHFNPFSPAAQQCPHQYYRAMQATTPAFHVEGTDMYMVTRHESIVPILRDTTTFSSDFATTGAMPGGEVAERIKAVIAQGWPPVPTMLTVDPPEHTRYRGTVAKCFTPKRMAELREPLEVIVRRRVAALPTGEFDWVEQLAVPVPVEAIALVLNVPADRMADFKRWSDDSIASIGTVISDDRRVDAYRGIVEFQHYFAARLEERRANPVGDLMSDLAQAEIDTDGDVSGDRAGGRRPLEMAEILSILQQLLAAGNETTTKAITEGTMLLARHP
ncbi:MAG: cytochrome P450, partial [Phycicoccus sp.]